jgi:hypothetical protein
MLFWIVVVTLAGLLGLFAFWPLSKDKSSKARLSPDDNPRTWYRDGRCSARHFFRTDQATGYLCEKNESARLFPTVVATHEAPIGVPS